MKITDEKIESIVREMPDPTPTVVASPEPVITVQQRAEVGGTDSIFDDDGEKKLIVESLTSNRSIRRNHQNSNRLIIPSIGPTAQRFNIMTDSLTVQIDHESPRQPTSSRHNNTSLLDQVGDKSSVTMNNSVFVISEHSTQDGSKYKGQMKLIKNENGNEILVQHG